MRLISFQIQKFRNIIDSTKVAVDDNVICLVGKNESGKTALLSGLYLLKPAYNEELSVSEHYPRWVKKNDQRTNEIELANTVRGVFRLDDNDISAVTSVLGEGVLQGDTFSYTKGYEGRTWADVKVDKKKALSNLIRQAGIKGDQRKELEQCEEVDELKEHIASLSVEGDSQLAGLLSHVNNLFEKTGVWQKVVNILKARMPTFFYFSEYSKLEGRIDLTKISSSAKSEPGSTSMQTVKALLALAETSVTAMSEDNYEERKAELEAVSNDLTQQVFEYWSQNEQLEVVIDIDIATALDPRDRLPLAASRFLDIRVRDRRHGYTSNFNQRSSGFQWFFSFLAAFSEFEGKGDVIVLLDEPGLALHAKAQADFLRFINERLAPAVQVIYTTHSPFMVEPGKLDRVRVVEDKGPRKGAVVSSEVSSVGSDTVFPLQAALGYDLAQNLYVGPYNLVVGKSSDYTYLTVISEHLKARGKRYLDKRLRVVPVGAMSNVPTFVALIGSGLEVSVLADSSAKGIQRINDMVNKDLLDKKRLITIGAVTGTKRADIEDVFSVDDYLLLYNAAFGTGHKASTLPDNDRIIKRIGLAEGSPFTDRGLPADYFLRNRDTILDSLAEESLDRFEKLIDLINQSLPS